MVNRVAGDTLRGKPTFHQVISSHLQKSMRKDQELIVITKTYDLILWSCNHTSKFPRSHRFVLGERIERNLYGLLETLIQAKYTKQRQRLLEDANLSLEVLRFQMRLAKDLQCLRVESYSFAAKSIDEIGRLAPQVTRPERPAWHTPSLPETHPERPGCRTISNREHHWIDLEVNSGVAKVRRYTEQRWVGPGAY